MTPSNKVTSGIENLTVWNMSNFMISSYSPETREWDVNKYIELIMHQYMLPFFSDTRVLGKF